MHVVESKGYERNIPGIACSLVHRGAARPSAASPWPMCLLRPHSAADALALACLSPDGLWTYFCWWCRRVRCLGHTERRRAAPSLLWNAAGPTTHTASNAINQATGISLISFWGGQPEKLHKQSWPRKLASFMWPSGFNEQVPLLCCLQCQFHFYS